MTHHPIVGPAKPNSGPHDPGKKFFVQLVTSTELDRYSFSTALELEEGLLEHDEETE